MERVIEVENLTKTFRPKRFQRDAASVRAVQDLSLTVSRGQIFGLLGPNGAGKTTTLRMLTTLTRPTSGRATILGFDTQSQPLEVRRRISCVLQETAVEMFLTVRDNLLTYARFHGLSGAVADRRAAKVMEMFHLGADASRKVQDLSGGYRRRVQVSKIFMVETPVVFLDEFSTGMDPILKRAVMEYLRAEASNGRTIVLTTQVLGEAEELCDDILIMNKGRQVARGSLHTLKLLSANVYEISMTFDRIPPGIETELERHNPLRLQIEGETVVVALRMEEAKVLELVSQLGRQGHVLRLEVSGASLEDIFVELTQEGS